MFANKVLQAITSVGTGSYQLNTSGTGAWNTWRSQFATGAQVAYYAENATGTVWEFGYGTLTSGTPDQISRTVLLTSTGSIIDWTSGDGTVYVMSVPWSQAMEGRWDATNSMFAPAGRKPWTAVGAANKTVTTADAGGRFSLDTSAAARTVLLPAISAVTMGFNIEVWGLSASYALILDPAGSDAVDSTAGGTNVALPGNCNTLIFSDGTQWRTLFRVTSTLGVPRGHIDGLTLSTTGSSTTFSVAAGEATDKNQTKVMKLASAMSKTTSAWVAGTGNGSLDTGSIANSTWYHVHLVKNLATGAVDILTSTSASAPTMPSGYTLSRRIGSIRTNGSAQWESFIQIGDRFRWVTPPADYSGTPGATTRADLTLTVPTGVIVFPHVMVSVTSGAGSGATVLLTSKDETDSAPSQALNHGSVVGALTAGPTVEANGLHTDTSARVGRRISATDAAMTVSTLGWIDQRGRNG